MKIAIDCRYILDPANGQFGGISEYTDGLVRAMLKEKTNAKFILFFSNKYSGNLTAEKFGATIIRVPAEKGNFFFNHLSFPRLVASFHPDIFFAPHGQLPLGWRGKAVVTVHDLAIFDHPEWFPGGFSHWFSTKLIVPTSIRRADKIIAVSEVTKKDLIRHFKIRPEKISVVYPAITIPTVNKITIEEIRKKFNLPEKYFFCLGTIEPRKNFSLAIQATKILSDQDIDVHLVLVGKRGWKWQETIEEIEKANQNKKIISELGYISTDEKYALLVGAQALIFPSFYEGFGLPALEAMTVGVPVITTDVEALHEVCDQAAQFVSTDEPYQLSVAIKDIYDKEKRNKLIDLGENQAAKFSWEKTAKKILKIF